LTIICSAIIMTELIDIDCTLKALLYADTDLEFPSIIPPLDLDQGIQFLKGDMGPRGPKGDIGLMGPKGDAGPQGDVGPVGPQGEVGPQGDVGPVGPQGDTGPKGDIGLQGESGPIGPQGPKGEKGDDGQQGPQGPKGDTGAGFQLANNAFFNTTESALEFGYSFKFVEVFNQQKSGTGDFVYLVAPLDSYSDTFMLNETGCVLDMSIECELSNSSLSNSRARLEVSATNDLTGDVVFRAENDIDKSGITKFVNEYKNITIDKDTPCSVSIRLIETNVQYVELTHNRLTNKLIWWANVERIHSYEIKRVGDKAFFAIKGCNLDREKAIENGVGTLYTDNGYLRVVTVQDLFVI
jgi:hypothetical protein